LYFCFTCIYSDLGLTRQLESQHGEGEKEGQEESCEEEVRPLLGGRFGGRRVRRDSRFSCPLRRARSFPEDGFPMTASRADANKRRAAEAALPHIPAGSVLGVGTGSTVRFLIEALAAHPGHVRAAVSSSNATTALLAAAGVPVLDLNDVAELPLYIDGADEATRARHLIKGGGGALTREKIVAAAAARFICIIDESKLVGALGAHPLPVEVIPMARTLVARRLQALGARPVWRQGFVTDNGNHILDVHGLAIADPPALEGELSAITGVVTVGLFARRPADLLLVGSDRGCDLI
jgi:ribose 5-phosphate isomerase A